MEPCGWSRGNAVAVEGGGEGGTMEGLCADGGWSMGVPWDKGILFCVFFDQVQKGD
jgi:hypothetical protein